MIEKIYDAIRENQRCIYNRGCRANIEATFGNWFPAFLKHLEMEIRANGKPEDVIVPTAKTARCHYGFHLRDYGGQKIFKVPGKKRFEKHKLFLIILVNIGAVVVTQQPRRGEDGVPLRLDVRPLWDAMLAKHSPQDLAVQADREAEAAAELNRRVRSETSGARTVDYFKRPVASVGIG